MKVDLTTLDEKGDSIPIGSIIWDGHNFSIDADNPAHEETLMAILKQPIVYHGAAYGESGKVEVTSKKDPVRWLHALATHYKGMYMRATKPYDEGKQ